MSLAFKSVNWLSLQQPLILMATMVTGKPITEIFAMEVHERLKLLDKLAGDIKDITAAGVAATDPAGPGGVTFTEEEWAKLVNEADDPKAVVQAIIGYHSGGDGASTGG